MRFIDNTKAQYVVAVQSSGFTYMGVIVYDVTRALDKIEA